MNKRPNIIIFNPDQMRTDSMGHFGNAAGATPFLDQFTAEEAVSFKNAFCQSTVCVPSRCSFTTGLYPHVNGHRTMSHLLRTHETSLFEELKNAGYHVWMNTRNDLVAGQIPGLVERHATEIFYGGNSLNAPGPVSKEGKGPGGKHFYAMYGGELGLEESGKRFGSDDEDLAAAIERIRNAPEDKPLCIFLGLQNPHPPYQVEEPFYSAIDRTLVPPRIRHEGGKGKPRMHDLIRQNQALEYSEEDWTELRATYLGMCKKVDYMFEMLCQTLKEAGIYDESLIIFLVDHGDYTGDYGIAEKSQNTFEDCLTRVPLLIKPPKGTKTDCGIAQGMTELVDFYATVMDFAGVAPSHSHFGRSLRPVLEDRSLELREFACCEGGRLPTEKHCDEFHVSNGPKGTPKNNPYWPRHFAQTDDEAHAKGIMLRTKHHKYISRVNGKDEFYDLEKDPEELINCADDPEYAGKLLEHQLKLMRWLIETSDIVPYNHDSRFTEEMIWAKVKTIVPVEYENEVREKIRSGMNPYAVMHYCRERFGSDKKTN